MDNYVWSLLNAVQRQNEASSRQLEARWNLKGINPFSINISVSRLKIYIHMLFKISIYLCFFQGALNPVRESRFVSTSRAQTKYNSIGIIHVQRA